MQYAIADFPDIKKIAKFEIKKNKEKLCEEFTIKIVSLGNNLRTLAVLLFVDMPLVWLNVFKS